MTDVLVMYKEMARAIADKIQVKLTPQEETILASTPQVNPEAYKAYTKGKFHYYKLNPQDLELALRYFELAREKDPNSALAYAGIASVWVGLQQQGEVSSSEAGPKAKAAAMKALELDDTLAEVHNVLAGIKAWTDWDWEGAEKAFRRAIELNPNYPEARPGYSHLLFTMRRPEEAMAQLERALELDPFNVHFRDLYAMGLNIARRYDEAIALARETLRTAPNNLQVMSTLKSAYHHKGMYEEALEIWKRYYATRGDREAEEALARGYAEAGYSGALSRLAEMMIKRSRTSFVTPWRIGTLYTRAGKNDKALEWLEKAYEAHDPNMPYISVDPIFDVLIDDSRFQDLLRRMNFPQGK
jgi:tetratricopeptide (TPR) repeat protein